MLLSSKVGVLNLIKPKATEQINEDVNKAFDLKTQASSPLEKGAAD